MWRRPQLRASLNLFGDTVQSASASGTVLSAPVSRPKRTRTLLRTDRYVRCQLEPQRVPLVLAESLDANSD